jgi:sensor histidine kinase YesM
MSVSVLERSFIYGAVVSMLCYGCIFFIQYRFLIRLSNAKSKTVRCVIFMALSFLSIGISLYFDLSLAFSMLLMCSSSFLFIKYILKQPPGLSLFFCILINVIEQLAVGTMAPIDYLLYGQNSGILQYQFAVLISSINFIVISALMFWLIAKKIDLKPAQLNRYLLILLIPLMLLALLFNLAENMEIWTTTTMVDTETGTVKTLKSLSFAQECGVMGISITAFACVFTSMFAFGKVTAFYRTEQERMILEQQIHAQKIYIEEAKIRQMQTMSFRHDIKNHLVVVNGLLEKNKTEEAREYLNKLGMAAENLSFFCSTGNAAIDALLSNKLSAAQQEKIAVACNVSVPKKCGLDDFDVCVILANAIDNAITACKFVAETSRYIKLSTRLEGDFFMIEILNSCHPTKKYAGGTGLGIPNIRQVAEKYRGSVTAEINGDCFCLYVLLILSKQ